MWHWIKALDRVLKGEATRPAALRGGAIDLPLGGLSFVLLILGAIYGACMGSFALVARWNSPEHYMAYQQMAYSAAKVPVLFFLTVLVTFPSLYVFNALVGSRLSAGSLLRLLVAALGVTLAVLASFGTIVVFFSLSSTSYAFMVLLNVAVFAVAGLLGMGFLLQTLHRLSQAQVLALEQPSSLASAHAPEPPAQAVPPPLHPGSYASVYPAPPPSPGALERLDGQAVARNVKSVFRIWIIVFGLVGAQMGWMLRPFIGNPNKPVTFFRERESNFFEAVFDKLGDVMGGGSRGGWQNRRDRNAGAPNPPKAPATNPSGYGP